MDALPAHLKVCGRVRFDDELLLVKAKPVRDIGFQCQLWYVHIPHLTHAAIRGFCEHHQTQVNALAARGGVGVVVYDISDMSVIDSWMSVCVPFVAMMQTHNHDGTLQRWLSRAIVLVTDETIRSTLHMALSQMYKPTRPIQIVGSKSELSQALATCWAAGQEKSVPAKETTPSP